MLLLANIASMLLPQTRCFGPRRSLYRWAGVQVDDSAKINGTVRVHYPNVTIGADTWLGAGAQVIPTSRAAVTIGARCDIGPGVMFVVGSHELGDRHRRAGRGTSRPIHVGDGTWVGARVTLLGGSATGKGCVIAAGALVRDVFPDNVLIAGTPARVVRALPVNAVASEPEVQVIEPDGADRMQ
jgi:maltose O-acetyltransferase